jgi:AcrR family transcriptional regulator
MTRRIPLRERKFARTKLGLLRAATAQLEKRSLEEISIRDLCAAVEISEASFFNYFPRKADLLAYYVQIWALEMEWHARRVAPERGALAAIDDVFARTAREVARHPALMAEIVAFQARLAAPSMPAEISLAERLLAFPDLQGIEDVPAGHLGTLLPWLIDRAIAGGELPADVDRATVLATLATVFFGVPVVLRHVDPAKVESLYRAELDVVWAGLRARSANKEARS